MTDDAVMTAAQNMHAELGAALELFVDGHYDEALRKAAQRFINRVQELANREDLNGVALMHQTFSENTPLLAFNDRSTLVERDEHNGFRFLAVGLTQAIRNVFTHSDQYGLDRVSAFEWLMFVSAMHRRLDNSVQVVEAAG